jgi:hypothetical protein
MGWVDRHNRFRQDILGLHNIWKTKRWQTRVQIELMAMALVDAFLRELLPKKSLTNPNRLSSDSFVNCFLPWPMQLKPLRCGKCVPNAAKCLLGKEL